MGNELCYRKRARFVDNHFMLYPAKLGGVIDTDAGTQSSIS